MKNERISPARLAVACLALTTWVALGACPAFASGAPHGLEGPHGIGSQGSGLEINPNDSALNAEINPNGLALNAEINPNGLALNAEINPNGLASGRIGTVDPASSPGLCPAQAPVGLLNQVDSQVVGLFRP